MMLFGSTTPMVLYHKTQKDRLAKIRRQGLKPHVKFGPWINPSRLKVSPSSGLRLIQPPGPTRGTTTKLSAMTGCCLRSSSIGKTRSFGTTSRGATPARSARFGRTQIIPWLGSSISAGFRPQLL
jgi:hypothetical protein